MSTHDVDLAIVGAGPAGMSAAIRASALGLTVAVFDEAPAPGGQIHRAIEARVGEDDEDSRDGRALVAAFRASGAAYHPSTSVWQIETGFTLFHSTGGVARTTTARRVLIAVGAIERPVPIPGWTLPGVMTVGAAQILLKTSRMVPDVPFVIAGQGPLPLLYVTQLLDKGVKPDLLALTTPPGAYARAFPFIGGALANWRYLARGLRMMARIRSAGVKIVSGVTEVAALGTDRVERVRITAGGRAREIAASTLLLHEGVVPHVHMSLALGAAHRFDEMTRARVPVVDEWGDTSIAGLAIAGDAGGITGARAATTRGALAALSAAHGIGKIDASERDRLAAPIRKVHAEHAQVRAFLDAWYRPSMSVLRPADDVIACRCEEKTVADVRAAVAMGCLGPNQVKSLTRCGMGPCQGRECMATIAEVIADARGIPVSELDVARVRPPLKPLTLGELASLAEKRA